MVTLVEKDGKYVVSGPYREMVEVIPRLKALKFSWEPSSRTWWAPISTLTPVKIRNLKKLIDETNGVPSPKVQDAKPVDLEAVHKVFRKAMEMRLLGFRFEEVFNSPNGKNLRLSGQTKDLEGEIRRAGGKQYPSTNAWLFADVDVNVKAFEKLLDELEARSNRNAVRLSRVKDVFPSSGERKWERIDARMRFEEDLRRIVIQCKYDHNDIVRRFIYDLEWASSFRGWIASAYKADPENLRKLMAEFDRLEAAAEARAQAEPQRTAPSTPQRRTNARPGPCTRCHHTVRPGDGWLTQEYDDMEDEMVWLVTHKDESTCKAILEQARVEMEAHRRKEQAKRQLRDIAERTGTKPEPGGYPRGQSIVLRPSAYGGESVVVEPDDRHFWYVVDNGADGDNWAINNLPGAYGWRAPLTDEVRAILRGLSDGAYKGGEAG